MKEPPLQERVRHRLRSLVAARNVPHEVLGKYLGLSRSAVTRLLNDEGGGIGFQHLEKLCEFFQVTPCELMNPPTSLIQEVKPDEAQLLTHFRQLTYTQRQGLLAVLEGRLSQPARPKRSRAGHAELTEEQQALIDLYVRSQPQAREGVMQILRGTARDGDGPRTRKSDTTE